MATGFDCAQPDMLVYIFRPVFVILPTGTMSAVEEDIGNQN